VIIAEATRRALDHTFERSQAMFPEVEVGGPWTRLPALTAGFYAGAPPMHGFRSVSSGQQETLLQSLRATRPVTTMWMISALGASLAVAGLVLATLGPGERGTHVALQSTARLSFVLFWLAYTGGALATLFGQAFKPLKHRAREFGLAFASAHLVHIALVVWLVYIGAAPSLGSFVFFGIAALWTYLLALASIPRLQQALGFAGWWLLRVVGLNYIAYAFAADFSRYPQFSGIKYLIGYLPFTVLSLAGPILCLAAFAQRKLNIAQTLTR
jgi:hypothetical protein